jgi:hypothetical protein
MAGFDVTIEAPGLVHDVDSFDRVGFTQEAVGTSQKERVFRFFRS